MSEWGDPGTDSPCCGARDGVCSCEPPEQLCEWCGRTLRDGEVDYCLRCELHAPIDAGEIA